MIKKTVYEFNPDDVDNALRTYWTGRLAEMRLLPVAGTDPIFGVGCTDKMIEDACQAVVEKQVKPPAGTVWKFCLMRDPDGRGSVNVVLT